MTTNARRQSLSIGDLARLRAFEAVARLNSVRQAGAELGISSGAISQHIKAIEAAAGAPVFRRAERGMRLTQLGQELYCHARTAMDAAHAMMADLKTARPRVEAGFYSDCTEPKP